MVGMQRSPIQSRNRTWMPTGSPVPGEPVAGATSGNSGLLDVPAHAQEYVNMLVLVQMAAKVALEGLAEKLRAVTARHLATQTQIAAATEVDQATISRILNGQRRRFTPRLVRLEEYVNMLLRQEKLSPKVQEAATSFLVRGGDGGGAGGVDRTLGGFGSAEAASQHSRVRREVAGGGGSPAP